MPRSILSYLFDLLYWIVVLALATIAYTPSDSSGNSSFETWWKDVVSDRDEALAFLDHVEREWKIEHDVHLDLEILNGKSLSNISRRPSANLVCLVLAGHDPATHPNQPVFKVSLHNDDIGPLYLS